MKKLMKMVKRYGVWIGAITGTFGLLHYLMTDGPVYWGWTKHLFVIGTELLLVIVLK